MSYIHKQLLTFILTLNRINPNMAVQYFRLRPVGQYFRLRPGKNKNFSFEKKWTTMASASPQPMQTDKGSSLSRLRDEMKQHQRVGGEHLGLNDVQMILQER